VQPHTVKRFSLSNLSYGSIAYLVSLLGTLLLPSELTRPRAVLLLIGAAVLAVFAWRRQKWTPAFPEHSVTRMPSLLRSRLHLLGMLTAFLLVLAAALRYLAAPNETFGVAGTLWLAGIAVLLCSVFVGSRTADRAEELTLTPWNPCEVAVFTGLVLVALFTRVWDLTSFPDNIYPDEIMTGTVAIHSYISHTGPSPSVFGTVWGGIDLPALWFWIVSLFLKLGGSTLAMLRLPAALFGAATVIPLYGLIRGTWGRYAAIAGAAILAFSVSNIHYSRLALCIAWTTVTPVDGLGVGRPVGRTKRVLLLWHTAAAVYPDSVLLLPLGFSLEAGTSMSEWFSALHPRLSDRIWPPPVPLYLEA
jgi:hypothetical protein